MTVTAEISGNTAVRVLLIENSIESPATDLGAPQLHIVREQSDSLDSFAAALVRTNPDVIVAPAQDHGSALEFVKISQEICPAAPLILVVDDLDEQSAVTALRAGAESLIRRNNFHRLHDVIDKALEVRKPLRLLSRRQLEVLRLVAAGNTTRAIADSLGLS